MRLSRYFVVYDEFDNIIAYLEGWEEICEFFKKTKAQVQDSLCRMRIGRHKCMYMTGSYRKYHVESYKE